MIKQYFFKILFIFSSLLLFGCQPKAHSLSANISVGDPSAFSYYLLNPNIENKPLSVVSLVNDNKIRIGANYLVLDRYQVGSVPVGPDLQHGNVLTGSGPFSFGSDVEATNLPVPGTFAGTKFVIPHHRGQHFYYVYSLSGSSGPASVTVTIGGNAESSIPPLPLANGFVTKEPINAGSTKGTSGIIESDLPILVAHVGRDDLGNWIDAYPVPPATDKLWGAQAMDTVIGALFDLTTVTISYEDGSSDGPITLNRGGSFNLRNALATSGRGKAMYLSAVYPPDPSKPTQTVAAPIAAIQVADGDGGETTAFLGRAHMARRYALPIDAEYISVVCAEWDTNVTLYKFYEADLTKRKMTRPCGKNNAPGKAYFDAGTNGTALRKGTIIESDKPIFMTIEAAASNDEQNLTGLDFRNHILNPQLATDSLPIYSLGNNNRVLVGSIDQYLMNEEFLSIPSQQLNQGTVISASAPFTVGSTVNGTDLPVPASFAGTDFVIPHRRGSHTYYIKSLYAKARVRLSYSTHPVPTEIDIDRGDVYVFPAGIINGISAIIQSDTAILVTHVGHFQGEQADVYPVPPAAKELWGIESVAPTFGALRDNTQITIRYNDGKPPPERQPRLLNAGDLLNLNTSQVDGMGRAMHITANEPIAGVQVDDGDGAESTAFLGGGHLSSRYIIPIDAQYVAVACPYSDTYVRLEINGELQNLKPCLSASENLPGKAYFGGAAGVNVVAGTNLISNRPVYVSYETNVNNDEHNLLGSERTRGRNILVIVADDLGVDKLAAYNESTGDTDDPYVPVTPNIDRLAKEGVLFRNVWSNPNCSPTRATIQTGRYATQTGVEFVAGNYKTNSEEEYLPIQLDVDNEFTIPKILDRNQHLNYVHAAFGKWHLNFEDPVDTTAPDHMLRAGYSYFQGSFGGGLFPERSENYVSWTKITASKGDVPTAKTNTNYATQENVIDATKWIKQQEKANSPWFVWLAFNAPHDPFHVPPTGYEPNTNLENLNLPPDEQCPPGENNAIVKQCYKAMVEAMDYEIGKLVYNTHPTDIQGLTDEERARTTIIFLGDNGTPFKVAHGIPSGQAKASPYEGGINVPLIVAGTEFDHPRCDNGGSVNSMLPCESGALVNTTDLYATILELAGVNLSSTVPESYPQNANPNNIPQDLDVNLNSISLVPILQGSNFGERRKYAFAELSPPPFPDRSGGFESAVKTVRDGRYKLIRFYDIDDPSQMKKEEFYDMQGVDFEHLTTALVYDNLNSAQKVAYNCLSCKIDNLINLNNNACENEFPKRCL